MPANRQRQIQISSPLITQLDTRALPPVATFRADRFFAFLWLSLPLMLWLLFGAWFEIHAQDGPPFDRAEVPLPVGQPMARPGGAIYIENCAPCHGERGESDGPVVSDLPAPPPLFADPETVWGQSPAAYFHVTKFGRIQNLMPPWGNRLSDEEIWQAVFYAWSLHTDQDAVAAGEQLLDMALVEAEDALRPSSVTAADVDALLADPQTLFLSQAELADELMGLLPGQDWSQTEWARVADFGRTVAYVPPWASAYRAGSGRAEGRVALVLPDGSSQPLDAALDVVVSAVANREVVATFDVATDDAGNFALADLSTNSNIVYVAEATYNDVLYRGEPFQLSDSAPLAAPLLAVYESTDDASGVVISRLNWVVDNAPGELVVGQIMALGNRLTATFAGRTVEGTDRAVTAEIAIPAGAYDVRFQDGEIGERYVQVGERYYDTLPITPGEDTRQLFVSYRLPYEGTAKTLAQTINYPVGALNLLVADLPQLTETVDLLEFRGPNTIQNVTYRLWQGAEVAPQVLTITLDGLIAADGTDPRLANPAAGDLGAAGAPAAAPMPLSPWIPAGIGGLAAVLLAALVFVPFWRTRGAGPRVDMAETRDALIREVAELDDAFAAGKLGESEWSARRAVLKRRLVAVARTVKAGAEAEAKADPRLRHSGTGAEG